LDPLLNRAGVAMYPLVTRKDYEARAELVQKTKKKVILLLTISVPYLLQKVKLTLLATR